MATDALSSFWGPLAVALVGIVPATFTFFWGKRIERESAKVRLAEHSAKMLIERMNATREDAIALSAATRAIQNTQSGLIMELGEFSKAWNRSENSDYLLISAKTDIERIQKRLDNILKLTEKALEKAEIRPCGGLSDEFTRLEAKAIASSVRILSGYKSYLDTIKDQINLALTLLNVYVISGDGDAKNCLLQFGNDWDLYHQTLKELTGLNDIVMLSEEIRGLIDSQTRKPGIDLLKN